MDDGDTDATANGGQGDSRGAGEQTATGIVIFSVTSDPTLDRSRSRADIPEGRGGGNI